MDYGTLLIPVLVFSVFVSLGLALAYSFRRPRLQQRLDALRARGALTMRERLERPFTDRTVVLLLDMIARRVARFTKRERTEKTRRQLIQAGLSPRLTPARFEGLRWISGSLFLLFVPVGFSVTNLSANVAGADPPRLVDQLLDPQSLVMCLFVGLVGYCAPRAELGRRIHLRQQAILRALPSAIDLIAIAIEAGMGFDQALGYVRRRTTGPLSAEFGNTLNEIRLGKSRVEALQHLASRVNIEDLKVFVGAVIESFQLGSSLAQTLRIQADVTRVHQRQRVQEEVMKVPVKMLFPLVFFIFPTLLVVVLGPAAMSILTLWF